MLAAYESCENSNEEEGEKQGSADCKRKFCIAGEALEGERKAKLHPIFCRIHLICNRGDYRL